ncbi:MAG TPA: hypothetical protein VN958_08190, partial [Chitinophagaceae bacterium]|nr:hypothetical protein [Chitinophagaceae bacterium]
YSIFFDVCEANGYYWIAAYGTGILKVDKNYHIRKIISRKEGMPTTGIYTLVSLNDSLIFATSNYGLYYLNVKTVESRTFFESDGLSSSYNWNSSMKNGFIYVGGDKGFTIISPSFLEINPYIPELYLNNIKVETKTKSIDTSDLFFTNYTVPSDFLQTTVSFSGINYSNPSRTSYAYRIKELDDN